MTAPILIMAGGTGGHVYPALAIAEAWRTAGQPVVWLGTSRGLEARVVVAEGIPMEWLNITGWRGKGVLRWLTAPLQLSVAVVQAWRVIRRLRPRLVLGMGGFVSGPGGIAAWLARVPLVIHEQNAAPGLTNRWLSRIASRTLQGFPDALPGAHTVGNPVRAAIRNVPEPDTRFTERNGPLRLLVVGGSQGALALNTLVAPALALLAAREHHYVVRHQAGSGTLEQAQDAYADARVRAEVTPFIEDMAGALAWADLVVCRAGALTVTELMNVGLGAVFVPLPNAVDDHQRRNAAVLVAAGSALVLDQRTLTAAVLADAIAALGIDRDSLSSRARKARAERTVDAVSLVIDHCAQVLGQATGEVAS